MVRLHHAGQANSVQNPMHATKEFSMPFCCHPWEQAVWYWTCARQDQQRIQCRGSCRAARAAWSTSKEPSCQGCCHYCFIFNFFYTTHTQQYIVDVTSLQQHPHRCRRIPHALQQHMLQYDPVLPCSVCTSILPFSCPVFASAMQQATSLIDYKPSTQA